MADFMQYLESRGEKHQFKAYICDLSDFIKDMDIYTHIVVEQGELDSLKIYIEECEKRLQCLNEYIQEFENERKVTDDN